MEGPEEHDASSPDEAHSTHYPGFKGYSNHGQGLISNAKVHTDGLINLLLDCRKEFPDLPDDHAQEVNEFAVDPNCTSRPPMNIVIMIVGSRGDVQPYVALGQRLKRDGHRVRIASHEAFRKFVIDGGLEFYNIGGDPHDLMSYMVKNPGLIPGLASLTNGDIRRKRSMLKEMIHGCWKSCYAPCPETGKAFTVDAIISNPPGFAHIHCAEALGVPLQMSFTMPWSPTSAFPQPLVNITSSNAKPGLTNYLTYEIANLLTWQGTGDIINKFRRRTLNLNVLDIYSGPGIVDDLKVPWTYCMSPSLVPKPYDWKNHIDVVGFYFLDLAKSYDPPAELVTFLNAGEPPIYIGFGSVVVDDPQAMTELIFEATAQAGVRALVSAGWGGLGGTKVPPHIFILGNIPHDWLFDQERVAAVVHHGGAGTTAIGLAKGRPTVVVPFFGDQGFWGSMIYKSGAGPKPIPHRKLSVTSLTDAIKYAISPAAKAAAKEMAEKIRDDNGVQKGVESFYQHLPILNMQCDLDPSHLAVWWCTRYCLKLSALAAQTLVHAGLLKMDDLDLHRAKEHKLGHEDVKPENKSVFWSMTNFYEEVTDNLFRPIKGIFETTATVPHGVLQMVSSLVGSSNSAKSEKDSPEQKETKKPSSHETHNAFLDGISDAINHFTHHDRGSSKKEKIKNYIKIKVQESSNLHPSIFSWTECTIQAVEKQRRKERVEEGLRMFHDSTDLQRAQIISMFHNAEPQLEGRRKKYVEAAKRVLLRQEKHRKESVPTEPTSSVVTTVTEGSEPSEIDVEVQNRVDWDEAFESDLALGMKLSLEEGGRSGQTS